VVPPARKTAVTKGPGRPGRGVTFLQAMPDAKPRLRDRTGAGRCRSRAVTIDSAADCDDRRVFSECLGAWSTMQERNKRLENDKVRLISSLKPVAPQWVSSHTSRSRGVGKQLNSGLARWRR